MTEDYDYTGESPLQKCWENLAKEIDYLIKHRILKFIQTEDYVSLDIIDPVGLAIYYNLKFKGLLRDSETQEDLQE